MREASGTLVQLRFSIVCEVRYPFDSSVGFSRDPTRTYLLSIGPLLDFAEQDERV